MGPKELQYNTDTQKVVFLPCSDSSVWLMNHIKNTSHDVYYTRELISETRVKHMTDLEIRQSINRADLATFGSISYGVDLAVLSMCNHTLMDYGTFGVWASLLAGGRIILPTGYSNLSRPDMLWWSQAKLDKAEFID